MPAHLARTGVIVFAMVFALAVGSEHQAAGRAPAVAASPIDPRPTPAVIVRDEPVAVAGFQTSPQADDAAPVVQTVVAPQPESDVAVPSAAPVPSAVSVAPVTSDGVVLASWYGPGFYGNHTACGQVFTPEILGVAHLTLRCGTLLSLSYGGRVVTVPVIDRGPFVAGRTLDLSNATKVALGCTDLCTVRMQVLR